MNKLVQTQQYSARTERPMPKSKGRYATPATSAIRRNTKTWITECEQLVDALKFTKDLIVDDNGAEERLLLVDVLCHGCKV